MAKKKKEKKKLSRRRSEERGGSRLPPRQLMVLTSLMDENRYILVPHDPRREVAIAKIREGFEEEFPDAPELSNVQIRDQCVRIFNDYRSDASVTIRRFLKGGIAHIRRPLGTSPEGERIRFVYKKGEEVVDPDSEDEDQHDEPINNVPSLALPQSAATTTVENGSGDITTVQISASSTLLQDSEIERSLNVLVEKIFYNANTFTESCQRSQNASDVLSLVGSLSCPGQETDEWTSLPDNRLAAAIIGAIIFNWILSKENLAQLGALAEDAGSAMGQFGILSGQHGT